MGGIARGAKPAGMDRLGVRRTRVRGFEVDARFDPPASSLAVVEWTINDVPLTDLFKSGSDVPVINANADLDEVRENLFRLRGDRTDPPVHEARFERTWLDRLLGRRGVPWAPWQPAFEDGRVVLLVCWCGDLDCGAISTQVVLHDETVEWRDIGWQVTYEPFAPEIPARSTLFERTAYLQVIDGLLASDC